MPIYGRPRTGTSGGSRAGSLIHATATAGDGYERETSSDQVSAGMSEEAAERARASARAALARMEQAGITSGADYERLSQVAQTGTEWGTSGFLGWMGRLLGYLDRPAQLVRYGIMDVFDIGEGEHLTGEAYGDIIAGRTASLLQRYGPEVVGEDARMGGAHMLHQIGEGVGGEMGEFLRGENTFWGAGFLHGLASTGVEIATDPLTYAYGASAGTRANQLVKLAAGVLREKAAPEVLALALRGGSRSLGRTIRQGERMIVNLADDAVGRIATVRASRLTRFVDDIPGLSEASRATARTMSHTDLAASGLLDDAQRATLAGLMDERALTEAAVNLALDAKLDKMGPRLMARDWAHPDMEDFTHYSRTPPVLQGGIHLTPRPMLPLPGLWRVPEAAWTIPGTRGLGHRITRGILGRSSQVAGQQASGLRKGLEAIFPQLFHIGEGLAEALDFKNYYRNVMRGSLNASDVVGLEHFVTSIGQLAGTRKSLQQVQRALEDMVDAGQKVGWSERTMWEVVGNVPARLLQEVPADAVAARDMIRDALRGALRLTGGSAADVPDAVVNQFVRFAESWRNVMANTHKLMVQYKVVRPDARIADYFPMVYTPAGTDVIRQMARVGMVFGDTAEERMVAELVSAVQPRGGAAGRALGEAEHARERTFGAFLDLPSREGTTMLVDADELAVIVGSHPDLAQNVLLYTMLDTVRQGGRPALEGIDELNRKISEGVRRILNREQNRGKILLPRGTKPDDFRVFDTNPMTVAVAYLRDTHEAIVEAAAIQYLKDRGLIEAAERLLKGRASAHAIQRRLTDKPEPLLREITRLAARAGKQAQRQAKAETRVYTVRAAGRSFSLPVRAVSRDVERWFSSRARLLARTADVRAELERRTSVLARVLRNAGADADTAEILALAAADGAEFRTLLDQAERALDDSARVLAADMAATAAAKGESLAVVAAQMDEIAGAIAREREQVQRLAGRLSSLIREREVFETGILTAEQVLAAADHLPDLLGRLNRAAALMPGDAVAERIVTATGRLILGLERGTWEGLQEAADDLDEAIRMLAGREARADAMELREIMAGAVRRHAATRGAAERDTLMALAEEIEQADPADAVGILVRAGEPAPYVRWDPELGVARNELPPQGLYLSDAPSTIHGYPGAVGRGYRGLSPDARIAKVAEAQVAHPRFDLAGVGTPTEGWVDAGVSYLVGSVGRGEVEHLAALDLGELAEALVRRFPNLNVREVASYAQNGDTLDVLSMWGAQLAREQGYDAIRLTDRIAPELSETVVVSDRAFRAVSTTIGVSLPERVVADTLNAHLLASGGQEPEALRVLAQEGRTNPELLGDLNHLQDQVYAIGWVQNAKQAILGGARQEMPAMIDQMRLERGLRRLLRLPDDVSIRWGQTLIRGEDGRAVRVWGPLIRRGVGKAGVSYSGLKAALADAGLTVEQARRALLNGDHPLHPVASRLSAPVQSKLLTIADDVAADLDEQVERAARLARRQAATAGRMGPLPADVAERIERFAPATKHRDHGFGGALNQPSREPVPQGAVTGLPEARPRTVRDMLADLYDGPANLNRRLRAPAQTDAKAGTRFFLSDDGLSGFAVGEDGELFALFNVGEPGMGRTAAWRARQEGATWASIPAGREDLVRLLDEAGFIQQSRQGGRIIMSIPAETARKVAAQQARNLERLRVLGELQELADRGQWKQLAGRLDALKGKGLLAADRASVLRRTVDTRIMLESPTVTPVAKDVARASEALVRSLASAEKAQIAVAGEMQRLWRMYGNPEVRASEIIMSQVEQARELAAKFSELLARLNAETYIDDAAELEALKTLRAEVLEAANELGWKRMARAVRGGFQYGVEAPAGQILPKAYGLGGEQIAFRALKPGTAQMLASLVGNMQRLGTPEGLTLLAHQTRAIYHWWKGMATVVRPTFHIRNLIGGVWNNMIGFVRLRDYIWVRDKLARFRHYEGTLHDTEAALLKMGDRDGAVIRAMLDTGVLNSSFARAEAETLVRPATLFQKMNLLGTRGPAVRVGGAVMTTVEDFLRAAAFRRWYEYGADAAAEMTFALHFDYRHLGTLEHTIKKWVPFFVWTRRNLPLQLRALVERPDLIQKYQHLLHGFNDQADVNEPYDLPIPGMFNSAFTIETGLVFNADTPFWARAILSPDLPLTDLAEFEPLSPMSWLGFAGNMLGPQVTLPFELQQQAEYGGSVNAPAGLNEILYGLHRLGLYDNVSGDTAMMPRHLRWLIEALIPPWREWTAPWETDPGRRQALGLGPDRQPMSAEVLRAMGVLLGRGVGLQTATPTRTYGEAWGGQDVVREIVKQLELTGRIPRQP